MNKELSPQQKEVLELLTNHTPKQIASRRGTTVRAVYKIIKKLKDKGVQFRGFTKTGGSQRLGGSLFANKFVLRLHNMHFVIRVLYDSKFYHDSRSRGNWFLLDGHKVRLWRDKLEVYQSEEDFFVHEDVHRVTSLAFHYWNKFFLRLESRLKVVLLKEGYQSVRLVQSHYAEVNNELSEDCRSRSVPLKVFTRDDGRLWFVIDNSFNLSEAETVHSSSSKRDMEVVKGFFNDLREHNPPVNSELSQHIKSLVDDRRFYAEHIKSHVGAIQTLGVAVDRLSRKFLPSLFELIQEDDWVAGAYASLSMNERLKVLEGKK